MSRWDGVLLCRTKGVHGRDYGWASAWTGPRGRRTMARIDRLNYRDIGVIKAPLCQRTLLSKGVDKTRDLDSWHQGFHFPLRRSLPRSSTRSDETRSVTSSLASRRCFLNKPLSAHRRCPFDGSPLLPRFRRFQSRHVRKTRTPGPYTRAYA